VRGLAAKPVIPLSAAAHCASLTVNAVKLPRERKPRVRETVGKLASALTLDMAARWRPAARTYLGRVTKEHILAAVQEAGMKPPNGWPG
jgi:ParB family chromosome partitioning protein